MLNAKDRPNDSSDVLRFIVDLARQGDVAGYEVACGRVYLVNHPDLIRRVFQGGRYERSLLIRMALGEGLLTTEGEQWRRRRRVLQAPFRPQNLSALGPQVTTATVEMLDDWDATARVGGVIDVAHEMLKLTLRIILESMFNVRVDVETEGLLDAFSTIIEHLSHFGFVQFGIPQEISAVDHSKFRQAMDHVDDFVYDVIRARLTEKAPPDDLLALLVTAYQPSLSDLRSKTARSLRDEMVTLILAGHETSAMALAWTWHALSEHPQIEWSMFREIHCVLQGRLPEPGDLARLVTVRTVLEESMRMFPPVWFIGRKAIANDELGGCDVPAGSAIIVSPYTMHRHPAFWESPNVFDPDRFAQARAAERAPFSYIPFGGGRHLCIGNVLAMFEGQLVLATVAQRFRLRTVKGFPVEAEPLFTLRQRQGLLMSIERRPDFSTSSPDACSSVTHRAS